MNLQRSAFTLMELLVVLLILTVLIGMSAGAIIGSAETNTQVSNQRLLSGLIQQARNRSLSSNEAVVLRFDKDTGAIYGLHKQHLFYRNNVWHPFPKHSVLPRSIYLLFMMDGSEVKLP